MALLSQQCGIVSHAQVLRHHSKAYLRHKLAIGQWRRLLRGVYVTRPGPLTTEMQWWAAVLAAGDGAVLAGLAAARAGGLRVKSRRLIVDVLTTRDIRPLIRSRNVDVPLVRVHRSEKVKPVGAPPRTTMARSIVDAAQWALDDDEARLIVASACQQRLVSPQEVIGALGARVKRRALIGETARYAEGGATTLTEIGFVRLCRKHGLPPPDLQERRTDASGRMRFLDAYWREQKLHVEIDGAHHMEVKHWSADMLRQNEVWLKGDRVLRFPAHLVRSNPDVVMAQVKQALRDGES